MSLRKLMKKMDSSLLVTPRYERWLSTNHNIHLSDNIMEMLSDDLTTPQRDRTNTFSASSSGYCARQQVFKFTPAKPESKFTTSTIAVFHTGTFMHLKWQAQLLDAGILEDIEIPVRVDELNLTGTIDGAGNIPEDHELAHHQVFGWEFKTINTNGFKWVLDKGPNNGHLLQIHAYMLGTGWDVWSLIYEDKNTSEWKEFVVERDPDITNRVVAELEVMNEHVRNQTLPPVLSDCIEKKGPYRNCPFAHVCLDTDEWPKKG